MEKFIDKKPRRIIFIHYFRLMNEDEINYDLLRVWEAVNDMDLFTDITTKAGAI